MQAVTLTPLFRESVGFDRFNDLFESVLNNATPSKNTTYPPYNIEKYAENQYRITMAVAGFSLEDLNIITHGDLLTISGEVKDKEDSDVEYLHKGIATRAFEHKFNLSDYMKVQEASLTNGLLQIDLVREVPESSKPKMIEIKSDSSSDVRMVEGANKKKKPKLVS